MSGLVGGGPPPGPPISIEWTSQTERLLGAMATEVTLTQVKTAINALGTEATLNDILTILSSTLQVHLDNQNDVSGLATELTLQQAVTVLQTLGTVEVSNLPTVQTVHVDNPVSTTGLARDTTVQAVVSALGSLGTDATLGSILAKLNSALTVHQDNPTDVSALGKDSTLNSILAKLSNPLAVTMDTSGLATQATLAAILAALPALMADATGQAVAAAVTELAHGAFSFQPRALQYARAVDDSMRVTLQNTINANIVMLWGNFGSNPTLYGAGSGNAMDARENQRELSMQTFQQARNGRWVFS